MEYLKIYQQNYKGETVQAKELEGYLGTTYSGATYIPWATIERMAREQDPLTEWEVIDQNGRLLWTTQDSLSTDQKSVKENVLQEQSTFAEFFTHMVVIKVKFMGTTLTEYYPLQKTSKGSMYEATKIVDSNMLNNAIKRGMAKAYSRITGLGLKLYEGMDLQFEEEDVKLTPPKPSKAKKEKQVESDKNDRPLVSTDGEHPDMEEPLNHEAQEGVSEIVKFITENPGAEVALQKVNTAVAKKYGFTLSTKDNADELVTKLNKIPNPDTFLRTLVKFAG